MKKTTAIKKAGSAYRLAKLLGISKQAVSKWPENVPIQREAELRAYHPTWFRQPRAYPSYPPITEDQS